MDLATLEPRLENWARAQRSGGFERGGSAESAESRYRAPGWREVRAAPIPPDQADAALVQAAWLRLMPLDKEVLKLHYVWHAPSSFICRRLKLKQGRGHEHVWDFALYHAHGAISLMLDKADEFAKPIRCAYNAAQLNTESVD
jgi:toxin CptA